MRHYHLVGQMIQTGKANENGDIEQRHYRFKKAVEQTLMLRGSHDFTNREEYALFLRKLFIQLNAGRQERFKQELKVLNRLPNNRFDCCKRFTVKVGPSSTIRVSHNVYSVDSRLIGETIDIRLYAEYFEIWYGQRCLDKIPRLRGSSNHYIQYRHIIDWLVRKPGAFEDYRYRKDLFPTHRFRLAYDYFTTTMDDPTRKYYHRGNQEYVKLLHLAAKEGEMVVDEALAYLVDQSLPITLDAVISLVKDGNHKALFKDVQINEIDISVYDRLLGERMLV